MESKAEGVLDWHELERLGASPADPVNGPTSAQARLRLFGQPEEAVRVTLFRDHHAWCPYCQKVWLWLEEKRIPYRIRKVTMFCYGEKEAWFKRLVPSGMLPALELDGRLITESDRILEALEGAFGPLGLGMNDPAVLPLRQLERLLFRAWCQWLCSPGLRPAQEQAARAAFQRIAGKFEQTLSQQSGPFLLGELGTADLVFVPYVERMAASLAYYKGFLLRSEHPAIGRWFEALEQRPSYLGTQSDFHTHAHDLPPQMGGCYASGDANQQALATQIDRGPWPLGSPDQETSQAEPANAAAFDQAPSGNSWPQPPGSGKIRCPAPHSSHGPGPRQAPASTGGLCPCPALPARSHQRAPGYAAACGSAPAPGPGGDCQSRSSGWHSPGGADSGGPSPRSGSPAIPAGRS